MYQGIERFNGRLFKVYMKTQVMEEIGYNINMTFQNIFRLVTNKNIVQVGGYFNIFRSNADTFINHYYSPAPDTPVGRIILNESPPEG